MKSKVIKGLVVALIASFITVPMAIISTAPANAAVPNTSSVGYDFNLAFTPGLNSPVWSVYLSSDETGTATFNWANGTSTTVNIVPGAVTTQVVDNANVLGSEVNVVTNKVTRLSSTVPTSVYSCSYAAATSDCTAVFPTATWGNRYRSLYVSGSSERLTILSGSDTATVAITPKTTVTTSTSFSSMVGGTTYSVVIPPNSLWSSGGGGGDFSGTLITSTSNIGVFAGNTCDNFNSTFPTSATACDTAIQMLPPTATWGNSYYTVNYKNKGTNGSGYRIVADQESTTVTITGDTTGISPTTKTLAAGEVWTFAAFAGTGSSPNQSLTISATKPVLVGHYVFNGSAGGYSSLGLSDTGDASMSYLTPFQQFLDHYTITNPASFKASFINLVVPESSTASMTLDGATISASEFRSIAGAPWKTAQLEVSSGTHTLRAAQAFGIEVYGMDNYNSYAYTGGQNFSAIANVAALHINAVSIDGILGQQVCVPVEVLDANGVPVSGVRVDATINGVSGTILTNALADTRGIAKICYNGSTTGVDNLSFLANGFSASATVTWTLHGPAISYAPDSFTVDTTYAMYTLTPTNLGGPVDTWTVTPALPAGLSLNTTTGVISGTATTLQSSTSYVVSAMNSIDTSTATINIEVAAAAAPTISYSPSTVSLLLDGSITPIAPSVSGTFPTWSISPALPSGLVFNTQSGRITGTPDRLSAATTYTVTAHNNSGTTTTTISLAVVAAAPNISYSASSYTFSQNVALSVLTPSNSGSPATSWSISPALPAGMAFSAVNGSISGTPTGSSSSGNYTVTATNTGGSSTFVLAITVGAVSAPSISYSPNSISATIGSAITNLTPTNSGGGVNSWSISPSLPAGLSFNTSTGVISGTATAASASATYTITATNGGGSVTTTITVSSAAAAAPSAPSTFVPPAVVFSTISLGVLTANTPFTGALVAENAIAYDLESGSLPAGLTLDTWTGKITGTPTSNGAYSFTVRARSMYSVFASRTFSGTVDAVVVVVKPDPVVVVIKPLDPVKPTETTQGPAITPVLVNGAPSGFVIVPNSTQNGLLVNADNWSLKLRALDSNGNLVPLAPTEHLVVNQGHSVGVDGTGFKPNSDVKVYVFSDPIMLGTVKTDGAGAFAATLPIAQDFAIGNHTLQVSGYSPKDDVRTASVGLLVKETAKTTAVVEAAAAKRASRVVPFAKAKYKIGTSQAAVIKQLPIKSKSIIVVTGYADATSGQDDIRVSLDRALEVKAAILKRFPKAQVTALGGGTKLNVLCKATKNKCAVVRVIKK